MMKYLVFIGVFMITACSTIPKQIGGEKDAYGCLTAAGQTWSVLKQECIQVFNVADIQFPDPKNDTLAVYVILSEDRQHAELFASDIEQGTILTAVKGGFISKDRRIRLLNTEKGWKLYTSF